MNDLNPKEFFRTYDETLEKAKVKLSDYKKSRGHVLNDQFELVGRVYKVHIGNYNDLNALFSKYYSLDFALKFWSLDGEKNREPFILDLIRVLHNFLSSAFTLIEHTRIVNRLMYAGHKFLREYEVKVTTDLAGSSLIQFVKKFRNYVTHVGVAPLRLRNEIKNGEFTVDLTIIKDELLKHDAWNEKSLEFINRIDKEASLRPIIDSYCKRVQDFYLWYQDKLFDNFKAEFEETMRLQKEYNDLVALSEVHRLEGIRAMNEAGSKRREAAGNS